MYTRQTITPSCLTTPLPKQIKNKLVSVSRKLKYPPVVKKPKDDIVLFVNRKSSYFIGFGDDGN